LRRGFSHPTTRERTIATAFTARGDELYNAKKYADAAAAYRAASETDPDYNGRLWYYLGCSLGLAGSGIATCEAEIPCYENAVSSLAGRTRAGT